MVKLTQSLEHWLFENHKDKFALIAMFGHVELFTEEMEKDYMAWVGTEEGKKYLEGGEFYDPERSPYKQQEVT